MPKYVQASKLLKLLEIVVEVFFSFFATGVREILQFFFLSKSTKSCQFFAVQQFEMTANKLPSTQMILSIPKTVVLLLCYINCTSLTVV